MSEVACYLYGFTRDVPASELTGLSGLGGGPVRLVEREGLAAIVTTVDRAEFAEDVLEEKLQDVAWLSDTARTHHRVLCDVAARASVAPLRLATICLDDDSVRQRLADVAPTLRRSLDRATGRAEWSVKVFADDAPADDEPSGSVGSAGSARSTGSAAPAGPATRSGTDYLRRRRAQTEHRRRTVHQAAAVADDVHAELASLAAAARQLNPQDRRLTGERVTMVLNAAYLVTTASSDRFRDAIDGLRQRHSSARIDLAGPWPPYSFVSLDEP